MSQNQSDPIITISRQYGAGGRTVAKGLSEKLGLPWYDRDFVAKTAETSGYSVDEVNRAGEEISHAGSVMNSLLNNVASYISSYDAIHTAEKRVLLELSKKPCIIVGRCANILLRREGIPTFDIFLMADETFRLNRTMELSEYGKLEPKRYMAERDHLRETYYRHYTGHELGDYRDFDLIVNTAKVAPEICVELIASALANAKNA
jgi:cytidylate kinase